MKKITFWFLAGLLSITGTSSVLAQATVFGKNKVQYKDFEWYFIQSSHFDVYFTKGGDYLGEFTADIAESSYEAISKSFRYQIVNRIPVIVYNSHNDFQQTNVLTEYMEEGIGGVTELFKNRVVLPFEGDFGKFRHVIHHELVHAVINDMFYGGSIQSIITNNITLQLPLWFNEGLAEYEALHWETNSDMFLRDATIHENLPPLNYLEGYFAYRGGQSFWNYIATKYGDQKIGEILMRTKSMRNVDQGFRSAVGLNLEELSERWQKEQKVLYWPDIAKREDPADYATRLTNHKKDGGFYNTSPTISPQGDRIAFITNRDDYFDVFIMNAIDGSMLQKIVNGQRTADFEELHLLTPGMAWSPDGKRLALTAKSGDQDAVFVINVNTGKEEKFEFGLDGIFSVDWSPAEDKLAFIGNKKEQSDVYVYDLTTKGLTNLTDDIFSDADPAWSQDGKSIYFSSDRRDHIDRSAMPANFKMHTYGSRYHDVFRIDIASRLIKRITNFPTSDQTSPAAAPDGRRLLFISDMNGINNIYVKDLERDSVYPITNSLNGVYQLSLSQDGNKLAFSSLVNGGFDIFLMRTPLLRNLKVSVLEPTEFLKQSMAEPRHGEPAAAKKDTAAAAGNVVVNTEAEDSTEVAEEKSRMDFRNYVFGEAFGNKIEKNADTIRPITVTNNIDSSGHYVVNKYKLSFSPDIVYGNAGYNTYYGIQGSTIMAFSDMLGNHQIYLLTNLLFDLKNSDYALAYFYLPKRIDYGIEAYHSARFLYILNQTTDQESLYRFRNYGVLLSASLPVDKYNRYEFGLSWLNISRDNLDDPNTRSQQRSVILPSISYIHDTVLWGLIAPANGERYNVGAMASPKLGDQSLGFYSVLGDYRRYFKFWKNYTLALRLAGGGSFGENPQKFIVGGVDNWINRQFQNNRIPIDNAEDYVFLTAGIPLRGYDYGAEIGTKYALLNSEFRFPLFGYFAAGPIPVFFQTLTGIMFLDVGSAWTGSSYKAFDKDADGNLYMRDFLAGTGYGVRMVFLGFLVKLDVAWAFNLQQSSEPKYYLSLGADF